MPDLTQKALAGICDVSPTRIRQLVAEGAVTKNKRGKYSESAITEYIRFLRRSHAEVASTDQESNFSNLLEQEKYREKKRENDEAERLVAPIEELVAVLEKTIAVMIPPLEMLPLELKRNWPEITADQAELVKRAVAECRNSMATAEIDLDG